MARTCGSMLPCSPHHHERGVDQAPGLGRVRRPPVGDAPGPRGSSTARHGRNNVLHIRNTIPNPDRHRPTVTSVQPTAVDGHASAGRSGSVGAFDDQGALDLAGGGGAGERVDDRDAAGLLEGGEPVARRTRAATSTVTASRAGADDDHGGHDLAPLDVGHADDRDLGHVGMRRRAPPRPRAARPSHRRCGSRRARGRRSTRSRRRRARRDRRCGTSRRRAPPRSRRDRRSSRPSGTGCARRPRRARRAAPPRRAARRRRCPACGTRSASASASDGPGFGRSVEDAGHGVRERVLDRGEQLGRSRRRPGVGFDERSTGRSRRRRARGSRPHTAGMQYRRAARCRAVVASSVAASGTRTKCTARRRLPRAERDRPARHVEQREHAHGARRRPGVRGRAHERAQPVRRGATARHPSAGRCSRS